MTTPLRSVFSLLSLIVLALLAPSVGGRNITVDDTDSSHVSYSGPNSAKLPGWNAQPGCTVCFLKPNPDLAFNGTWHDDSWLAGDDKLFVNLTFTGTAVYVFNIIPNTETAGHTENTELQFTVDGSLSANTFDYTPNNQTAFIYNQSVFSVTGLSDTQHTVQMFLMGSQNVGALAVLFDYFVYTAEDETTTATSGTSTISSKSTLSNPTTATKSATSTTSATSSNPVTSTTRSTSSHAVTPSTSSNTAISSHSSSSATSTTLSPSNTTSHSHISAKIVTPAIVCLIAGALIASLL